MIPRHHDGLPGLLDRARALASTGSRRVLGIVGGPGSGKGTLAEKLVGELGSAAVVVPMDGFHLAEAALRRLGRPDRKGAPDTFDADGYVALLRRIREGAGTVYAPRFHREVEESYAGAIPVDPDVPLVITEGNYLLLDQTPWSGVRSLLDESWFLHQSDDELVSRLVERHVHHGKTRAEAEDWVHRSDMRNARLITPTQTRADLLVTDF